MPPEMLAATTRISGLVRERFPESVDGISYEDGLRCRWIAVRDSQRVELQTRARSTIHPIPASTKVLSMATAESTLDSLISSAIERNPHLKRRNLRFETQEGRVVLRGTVSSYYQKQMAQEALRRLKGVDHIENHLEVNWV